MAESVKVKSYTKEVDQAPRKVALVASLVRNRTVEDALVILSHTPKRASLAVKKAIESARANAVNNAGLDIKTLVIETVSVTTGTRLRRFKPASRGRALPFQKKTSNILIEVSGSKKIAKKPTTKVSTKVVKKETK